MQNLKDLNKICFIGAGNMASSIIGGLINSGVTPSLIHATDLHEGTRDATADKYGIKVSADNCSACDDANIIVLAVKPQGLKNVCEEIRNSLSAKTLIISIAAGINCDSLESWLGELAIVRAMPNTPALVGEGASGFFANQKVSAEQKQQAQQVLEAVGLAIEVEQETLIDSVTAVSGSGPAYFFLFIEEISKTGIAMGLSQETATKLAMQTALGAAKLALSSDVDVAELRRRVTSPKGTTEQAILSFQNNNFGEVVAKAMHACANRAAELADELGK